MGGGGNFLKANFRRPRHRLFLILVILVIIFLYMILMILSA